MQIATSKKLVIYESQKFFAYRIMLFNNNALHAPVRRRSRNERVFVLKNNSCDTVLCLLSISSTT